LNTNGLKTLRCNDTEIHVALEKEWKYKKSLLGYTSRELSELQDNWHNSVFKTQLHYKYLKTLKVLVTLQIPVALRNEWQSENTEF